MKDVFQKIYDDNKWDNGESVSGAGSTLKETAEVRRFLPQIVEQYDIRSMLDIPCGDLNWMDYMVQLDQIAYTGADIVPDIIAANKKAHPGGDFRVMDITTDALPPVDLILVRDCLGHFSNRDVRRALSNIKRSGAKYLLATHFPQEGTDTDIETGQWRAINMEKWLPQPMMTYPEILVKFGDGHESPKCLSLWELPSGK